MAALRAQNLDAIPRHRFLERYPKHFLYDCVSVTVFRMGAQLTLNHFLAEVKGAEVVYELTKEYNAKEAEVRGMDAASYLWLR
jgi:hypothetical protein